MMETSEIALRSKWHEGKLVICAFWGTCCNQQSSLAALPLDSLPADCKDLNDQTLIAKDIIYINAQKDRYSSLDISGFFKYFNV